MKKFEEMIFIKTAVSTGLMEAMKDFPEMLSCQELMVRVSKVTVKGLMTSRFSSTTFSVKGSVFLKPEERYEVVSIVFLIRESAS